MTFEYVMETVGPNGKAIIGRIMDWKSRRGDIELRDTDAGFHVCLRAKDKLVPLMQVWGKLNQPTSQVIETRKQWFPADLELSDEEERAIHILFRNARFKPTTGHFLNLRLSFGEEKNPTLTWGPEQLDNLERAVNETAEIVLNRYGH
jgi:hypothetical protein